MSYELVLEESVFDALCYEGQGFINLVKDYVSGTCQNPKSACLREIVETIKPYLENNNALFEAAIGTWASPRSTSHSGQITWKVKDGIKKAYTKFIKNPYYKTRAALSAGSAKYHAWRYKANKQSRNKNLNNFNDSLNKIHDRAEQETPNQSKHENTRAFLFGLRHGARATSSLLNAKRASENATSHQKSSAQSNKNRHEWISKVSK